MKNFTLPRAVTGKGVVRAIGLVAVLLGAVPVEGSAADCDQPEKICSIRESVFALTAFDPLASAVRVGASELVTSRHAIADEEVVTVFTHDGSPLRATVLPTDYVADVILLSVPDLPPGPHLEIPSEATASVGTPVYSIGPDAASRSIRAYPGGAVLMTPAAGRPLARLHHTAYSQPGNSGGALVAEDGTLIGIISSGGEGRFEAVPVAAVLALQQQSGDQFLPESKRIGEAVRKCTLMLEDRRGKRQPLTVKEADQLETACMGTENRQYFDLLAQEFGGSRMLERSFKASEASLNQDPNSLNARLVAAINYHLARWYEEEIPHLRFLMQHIPDDPQVIRLGIQAGIWGGDRDLAEEAFARLQASNPNMAPAAEKFMKEPPPRPPRMVLPQ